MKSLYDEIFYLKNKKRSLLRQIKQLEIKKEKYTPIFKTRWFALYKRVSKVS